MHGVGDESGKDESVLHTNTLRTSISVHLTTLEETLDTLLRRIMAGAANTTAGAFETFQVVFSIDRQNRCSPTACAVRLG